VLQLALGTARGRRRADDARPRIATTRTSPIKHVIVIIGENRSFDHVFATYRAQARRVVWNLLSKGIVNGRDGSFRDRTSTRRTAGRGPIRVDGRLPAEPAENRPSPTTCCPPPGPAAPRISYIPGGTRLTQCSQAWRSENGLPADYYPLFSDRRHRPDLADARPRIKNVNSSCRPDRSS
jgi:phospholipase C